MRQTQVKLSFSIVFIMILGISIRTHFLFHSFIRNTLAHTRTHDKRQTFAKSSYSLTFFLIVWPRCSIHTLTRAQRAQLSQFKPHRKFVHPATMTNSLFHASAIWCDVCILLLLLICLLCYAVYFKSYFRLVMLFDVGNSKYDVETKIRNSFQMDDLLRLIFTNSELLFHLFI